MQKQNTTFTQKVLHQKTVVTFTCIKMDSRDLLVKAEKKNGEKIFFFMNDQGKHLDKKDKFFSETSYAKAAKFKKKEEVLSEALRTHATRIADTHPTFSIAKMGSSKMTVTLGDIVGEKLQKLKLQTV